MNIKYNIFKIEPIDEAILKTLGINPRQLAARNSEREGRLPDLGREGGPKPDSKKTFSLSCGARFGL